MHIQPLGKQTSRITLKNERKRSDLAKLDGVIVEADRVYFPDSMTSIIQTMERAKLTPEEIKEREQKTPVQTSLFD